MKKTILTITLAMIMTFGATFANAGIIIGDKSTEPCANTETDGIIIGDLLEFFGIIIGDAPQACSQTDGIIIGD